MCEISLHVCGYKEVCVGISVLSYFQVPDRFVEVSEVALREFFTAIQSGRDADPCWKKSIYKIICKLDSPVPDSFRLPGCPMDTHRLV